jgi:hypothetical protein
MTTEETSNRLDVYLNKSMGGIVVNEYDKSLYLTDAQSMYVEEALANYEYGDKLRHILGKLLIEEEKDVNDAEDESTAAITHILISDDVKQIVFERTNDTIETIPLDYNDITEIEDNPFRQPNAAIAYRVTDNNKIKLYSSEVYAKYTYIYCKIPVPIVLEDLPDELELQGIERATESELPYDSVLQVIKLASELIYKDKARFMQKAEPQKQNN